MKVYRLRHNLFDLGPFALYREDCPAIWSASHVAPSSKKSVDYTVLHSFLNRYSLGAKIPKDYLFAFSSLEMLFESFPGWEGFKGLVVFEYELGPEGEDVCAFPSGQVIFKGYLSCSQVL